MKWSYPMVPIGDLVSSISKWDPRQSKTNEFLTYIDIASVSRETKKVEEATKILAYDAPSRARQLVESGDVLVSTVRPNLNAVAHLEDCFNGATASTGFTVLRAKSQKLDARYLYYWVRTPYFIQDMTRNSTGASYPAVSDSIIKNYGIPLPPIATQKRIAAILDKADTVRRKRQEAIRLTEELLRSAFLEMFGDPVTNPKGWDVGELQSLCSVIVDCPHATPKYSENKTPYPCLRSSDIQNGNLDLSTTKYVDLDQYKLRIKRHVPISGNVVYCREGARFGNAAVIPEGITPCLGQRMMLFQVNPLKTIPSFLSTLLNSQSVYLQADRLVAGSASPHINVGDIKRFKVFLPPIEIQKKFENFSSQVEKTRCDFMNTVDQQNNLFNSLLQRAFRGDL